MEAYKYTGKVKEIGKTQSWPSGFAKRTLVLEQDDGGKYPNYAVFEFVRGKGGDSSRDRTRDLDHILPGEEVTVSFFVNANENRNRPGQWFVSLRGVKVERGEQVRDLIEGSSAPAVAEPPDNIGAETDADDMPF